MPEPDDASFGTRRILQEIDQMRGDIKALDRKVDESSRRNESKTENAVNRIETKIDNTVLNRLSQIEIQYAGLHPEQFVRKDEFKPVRNVVWSMFAATLVGLVAAAWHWATAGGILK